MTMINAKAISIKIAEARKAASLTQTDLARKLNMSPQNVSKWERGESLPDAVTLAALADALNKDISFFYSEDGAITAATVTAYISDSDYEKPRAVLNERGNKWKKMDFAGVSMNRYDFKYTRFTECDFTSANFSANELPYPEFIRCKMSGADFSSCNFFRADFNSCDLTQAKFASSNLKQSDFNDCTLIRADFAGAKQEGTAFISCRIECVDFADQDFTSAVFKKTIFTDCTFTNCTFSDCNFKGAKFVNCTADKPSYNFLLTCNAPSDDIIIKPHKA